MRTVKQEEVVVTQMLDQENPHAACTRKWYMWNASMWNQRATYWLRTHNDPVNMRECRRRAAEMMRGANRARAATNGVYSGTITF